MRHIKLAATIAALILFATSCIKFEADISVSDDGSGRVDVLSAVDADGFGSVLGDLADGLGDATEGLGDVTDGLGDICDTFSEEGGFDEDVPDGAEVSVVDEDGFCGARVTYDLEPGTDHSAALAQLIDADVQLRKEGDGWIFSAPLDLEDLALDDLAGQNAGVPSALVDELFDDAIFQWTVDLPGIAVDGKNNADQVDGGTFTWTVDLLDPPANLFAQTRAGGDNSDTSGSDGGGGGRNLGLIFGIIAGLIVIAGLAWFLLNRKSSTATAPPPPSVGTMAAPVTGPPTYAAPGAPAAVSGPTGLAEPPPYRPQGSAPPSVAPQSVTATPPPPASSAAAPTPTAAPAPAPAAVPVDHTPANNGMVFDEALHVWTINDPVRGRLIHDPTSDEWRPL